MLLTGIFLYAGCGGGGGASVPLAPSNLSASGYSATQINLGWTDNSNNEDGFTIERKTDAGGTYSQVGTAGADSTSYQDTGLACETAYYYQVRSHNQAGESNYSEAVSATTLTCPPAIPGAPSHLTATVVSSFQINIYWQDNSSQEDGFKIERKTGTGGTYAQVGTAGADSAGYQDAGLTCAAEYYYRVRSYNAMGSSGYADEVNAATGICPAAPTNLLVAVVSAGQIDLTWSDNSSDESGFQVERKRGTGGEYFPIYTSPADVTNWSNPGLGGGPESETYFYRVSAYYPGGHSAYSNEASAAVPAGTTWPEGMTSVPADCFQMGDVSNVGLESERPAHTVCVSAFQMDIKEVTNSEYFSCVDNGPCKRPGDTGSATNRSDYYPTWSNYPVIKVSWSQAKTYCEWLGKRLPTEAEWEFAARGGLSGKKYPWGDDAPACTSGAFNGAQCGSCLPPHDTGPVGNFAPNGFGLYDLAGNVSEWVNDWYDAGYYSSSPILNPTGPSYATYRVLRGGNWSSSGSDLRVSQRDFDYPTAQDSLGRYGFRCVK
jgi:formylglycine-generating enzyme required for sulfatase activity